MVRQEAIVHLSEHDDDGFFYWVENNSDLMSKALNTLKHSEKDIEEYVKAIKVVSEYLEEYQELEL